MSDLPIHFVRNVGQWDEEVRFGAVRRGMKAALTDGGMTVALLAEETAEARTWHAVRFTFDRGDSPTPPVGERKLRGVHNYLLGNDPSKWHASVPLFEAVRYPHVAPGVSIVIQERDDLVAYDLEVEPGADLSAVEIRCEGASALAIEPDGSLAIETPAGTLRQTPPKAWYELGDGEMKLADCRFRLASDSAYGFDVVDPDPSLRLIVDPGLTWSTFLGTDAIDRIWALDFGGDLVTVAGETSTDDATSSFPTTPGSFQTTARGNIDAFVTRFDPAQFGSAQLVWSTFLGGAGEDYGLAVALTSTGRVAVGGRTTSPDFPLANPQAATISASLNDGFVAYLESDGSALLYGTYYGGPGGQTRVDDVAVDSDQRITFVGYTMSPSLPLVNAYDTDGGVNSFTLIGDGFVGRVDTTLQGAASLLYSSYVGGVGSTWACDDDGLTCVDLANAMIYVGGYTASGQFEVTNSAFDTTKDVARDGILLILDPAKVPANQLRYGTFVGGDNSDTIQDIQVHAAGASELIYACGDTWSSDFPRGTVNWREADPFINSRRGVADAFVIKLDRFFATAPNNDRQLRYGTYLGGDQFEQSWGIARFSDRCAVVVGYTNSTTSPGGFPVGAADPAGPYDGLYDNSGFDAFLTRLNWANNRPPTQQMDYSTFVGGLASEVPFGGVALCANESETAFPCRITVEGEG